MAPEGKLAPEKCFEAAEACGDWLLRNQALRRLDANRGRYLSHYFLEIKPGNKTQGYEPGVRGRTRVSYSVCWTTATAGMAALMLHERTGEQKYLDSVSLAARYLKSLQVLDARHPTPGTFHHNIPLDDKPGPGRDSTTAAWGMLHFGLALNDQDLLDRAVLYANCYAEHRFDSRYHFPLQKTHGATKSHICNGGEFNLFLDLYEKTGDKRWLDDIALPALDVIVTRFINDDGSPNLLVDFETGEVEGLKPGMDGLGDNRHGYNDDFTSLALLKAFRITGERRYLDGARRYLDWAAFGQHADGSFGEPISYKDAPPVLIMEMLDAQAALGRPVYASCIDKAVQHVLSLQVREHKKKEVRGAFYGLSPWVDIPKACVQVRTSGYALAALLRVEAARRYTLYSAGV